MLLPWTTWEFSWNETWICPQKELVRRVCFYMSVSFTVTSLCPFKQDDILKHLLGGLNTASHSRLLQNKCELVDRVCVGVWVCADSLAVRAEKEKRSGKRERMDTEYNDSLCLTKKREGGLYNTIINLSPFMFVRETIDAVLIVTFLWLHLSPM